MWRTKQEIDVVKQTLSDIGASDKPTIMLFNKIDAYSFIEKESDDLTPSTKQNLTLKDLENTWMAKANVPSIFISATEKLNVDQLKELLYDEVRKIRNKRYPAINTD
jgi:GTPase